MKASENIKHPKSPLEVSFYLLFAGWTVIILGIVLWSHNSIITETEVLAKREAYKGFEKDVMFRLWATMHGGVYVPIDSLTTPNPYLSEIKDRDITTPSGKELTLMNPAYITRQVHEISFRKLEIMGHITSLKPIRSENAPDKWETAALNSFEKGGKEYYGFDTIDNAVYYRYMGALITEKGCLKCHAQQGYKVGDIRGGISSAVPWKIYQDSISHQLSMAYIGYGILWLIGIAGLTIVKKRFVIYITRRDFAEQAMFKLNKDLLESKTLIEQNLKQNMELVEELTATKEKLTELIETKDKFFSIIAHDLKSPFVGFLGLTEMFAKNWQTMEKQDISLLSEKMNLSANNLFKLLTNLLEWTQMQKGEMNFVPVILNLNDAATHAIAAVSLRAEQKKINIFTDINDSIKIYADEKMFNSILVNLLSNAVKFTYASGLIKIIAEESENNQIKITVADTGIGIPKKNIDKLFKMGEKTGRKGTDGEESTGLGLILCKEFVEKNNGSIWVESGEGKGTTFSFTLPKA